MLKRLAVVSFAAILSSQSAGQPSATVALLGRYAAGEFADVQAALASTENFKRIYKDLKSDELKTWLEAGGTSDRRRRELAAATFALEAARADAWSEWKWLQRQPGFPLPVLYWMPPPLLIEWGCQLLRESRDPAPIERVWQLAAMSVAQRSEDVQFLIGFTKLETDEPIPILTPEATPQPSVLPSIGGIRVQTRGSEHFPDEVVNVQKEVGHLNHVVERFPTERRFVLGEGLARERPAPTEAIKLYTTLLEDPQVGGEAAVRLGALYLRQGRVPLALQMFDRAERVTRERDVLYLARFYRGQALLRTRKEAEAILAFRTALDVRPGSQSASIALATLLVKNEQRGEAQGVMKAVLDAGSDYRDPHLEYVHGDDRFWPVLIARLHAEIKK